jgi:hypothetical protein
MVEAELICFGLEQRSKSCLVHGLCLPASASIVYRIIGECLTVGASDTDAADTRLKDPNSHKFSYIDASLSGIGLRQKTPAGTSAESALTLPSPPRYVFGVLSDRLACSRQAQAGSGMGNLLADACRLRVKRRKTNVLLR